jgi:multidrug efflux pump subunit AcrA (membrane-fusion protein)
MSGRLRTTVGVATVAVVAGAGGAWAGIAASAPSSSGASASGAATATALAPIVRTTLTEQTTVPGTIGYDGAVTIVLPAGTAPAALGQVEQKATVDGLAVSAAQTAQADTATAANQSIGQAQAALAAAQSAVRTDQAQLQHDQSLGQPAAALAADNQALARDQAAVAQDAAALTSAQQHATQSEHQADGQLAAANAALSGDRTAVAQATRTALNPGTTFTAVPAVGQVVTQAQALYALDGRPVPLLYGTTTAWRAFSAGMDDGPDVAELNTALIALGFETSPASGAHFSVASAGAVSRLQASLALPQTGALALGDVVFGPGPLVVASVAVHPGSPAQPGATVLDATSTALVITAQIPLTDVGSVKPGDAVTIDLPNGREGAPGRVRDIGASVATSSGNGNQQQQPNNGGGGSGGTSSSAVDATVAFSDPSVATGLDQAAVLVHITTATVTGVLAVPLDALLALGEGGEGVEVVAGGVHRVVAVHVGLFTGTQVEVQGSGLAPGMDVVVPAS